MNQLLNVVVEVLLELVSGNLNAVTERLRLVFDLFENFLQVLELLWIN